VPKAIITGLRRFADAAEGIPVSIHHILFCWQTHFNNSPLWEPPWLVNSLKVLVDLGIYVAIWGVALGAMLAVAVFVIWLIVRAILRIRRKSADRA